MCFNVFAIECGMQHLREALEGDYEVVNSACGLRIKS